MSEQDILSNIPRPPAPPTRKQVVDYLEYALAALLRRRDTEVIPALKAMLTHDVSSDTIAGTYAENIRIGLALQKSIEDDVMREKRPYMDADRAAIGFRAGATADLIKLLAEARRLLLGWEQKKIAQAREAARARSEEAARKAEEAQAAAHRSAEAEGLWSAEAAHHAAMADQAREMADRHHQIAEGKASALGVATVGTYGARTMVRTTWDYRMTDWDAVPIEFKQLNDEAVKAPMRVRDPQTGKPVREIPGIEWFSSETLG